MDHRLAMSGKKVPYLYDRYPPRVSTLTGLPASPWRMGGTAATRFAISCRDSGVENSDTMAWLTPIRIRPIRPPTSRVARRESRMVLPKTDPSP